MSVSNLPNCPRCGASLPGDAPKGLCPRCLAAMNLSTETAFTGADGVAAQPSLTPAELAPHFPQLEILACLGRGGMGVVYKARQKSLNRLVALKLLAPERANDQQFAGRFEREAQALAALNHPHIVGVYDFGQAGGFYFLLMEFVDGVNLRQAMKAGRFTPEQALAVVPPVCEALQFAHEHGIVHRDIKPENLLLDKQGRVKIADFGIAKMLGEATTRVGMAESQPVGTPQYMAPEQKEHRTTDHRADIYSLGVVLYEMLTGELPADKLQRPSKRVQVNVHIDEIVLRALEAKPERRYQTAGEFRTHVVTMTSGGADAPPVEPSAASVSSRFSRAAVAALGLVILSGSAFLVWSMTGRIASPRAQIHTRIFEADAKLVDELVPEPTRKPGQLQDGEPEIPRAKAGSGRPPSRAPQTAEVSADVFARLLADGAIEPGLLDEEVREGYWWPKVATSSHYMRHGKIAGGGNLDGFLGLRRQKGVLQLRVEYNGMHGMNSAYQVVKIVWEGGAPPPEAARAFFIPISRTDGTARFLVIAVEVGNWIGDEGRISKAHAEKQRATIEARGS